MSVGTILMIIYFVFSISQSVPCVIKLIKTKKSNDYSLLNRLLQFIGLILLTLANTFNAVEKELQPLEIVSLIAGYVDLVALILENTLILRYYKRK